jgi:Zn ribbon nucleic-acid-binding protein
MNNDIEVIDNLSSKEVLEKLLRSAPYNYSSDLKGHILKRRGILFMDKDEYSHKWKENGIEYDFCLKCGCDTSTKYYSFGCPVSARAYNKFPFIAHKYGSFKMKRHNFYKFDACIKCGIIESREKILYKVDKVTGNAYEVSTPVGAKHKYIHCSLSDDEYAVRDILI